MTTEIYKYGCHIILFPDGHYNGNRKHLITWKDYSFEQYNKWKWYFRYRQAKWQIENPKAFVQLELFNYTFMSEEDLEKKRLKDKITGNKGKLTQYLNKLKLVEDNWNELFPIIDYEPYQRAQAKIFLLKNKISDLEIELSNL